MGPEGRWEQKQSRLRTEGRLPHHGPSDKPCAFKNCAGHTVHQLYGGPLSQPLPSPFFEMAEVRRLLVGITHNVFSVAPCGDAHCCLPYPHVASPQATDSTSPDCLAAQLLGPYYIFILISLREPRTVFQGWG